MYNYIHYYYTDNAPNNNMALAFMAVVKLSISMSKLGRKSICLIKMRHI